MGNSLLDICVFGRRAGAAAAAWVSHVKPGRPTLAHLAHWETDRSKNKALPNRPAPVILPDYTRR